MLLFAAGATSWVGPTVPPRRRGRVIRVAAKLGLWEERDMQPTLYTNVVGGGSFMKACHAGMVVCREQQDTVLPLLEKMRTYDFFSFFAVDLLSSCGYMPTEFEPCALDACEIDPSEEVPERIIERDEDEYEFKLDTFARWDQPSDFTEYYDLRLLAERNTGYDGRRVWRFIHNKICFQNEIEAPQNGWKRDFNRAISGMHAAVDAQIINDIGITPEGLLEYRRRIRDEPGCVENLYFAYMLTLCAIRDSRVRLDACNYLGEGPEVRPVMQALTASDLATHPDVQRVVDTLRRHASSGAVWKVRLRTRDLLRIMNCVQCNLCRLHGKVLAMGIASALNVLLGDDGEGGDILELDRVEIGALGATCAKLGAACEVVERFRKADEEAGEAA